MCIAILNKSGIMPEQHIRTSFANNSDGAGMAWIESGQIKVYKTMKSIDRLIERYKAIRLDNDLPIMLHFRIKTHGKTDIANVHPFHIANDLVMAHNGILDTPSIYKDKSDTYHFALFLGKLTTYKNLVDANSLEFNMAQEFCGNYSKLIFLSNDGKTSIANEDLGHWVADTWYSNYTYLYGYYDKGGKTTAKKGCYTPYSDYIDDWTDDLEDEPYKPKMSYYSDDTDEYCRAMFCEEYGIFGSYLADMAIDWNDPEAWDIENYREYNGVLYYVKPIGKGGLK